MRLEFSSIADSSLKSDSFLAQKKGKYFLQAKVKWDSNTAEYNRYFKIKKRSIDIEYLEIPESQFFYSYYENDKFALSPNSNHVIYIRSSERLSLDSSYVQIVIRYGTNFENVTVLDISGIDSSYINQNTITRISADGSTAYVICSNTTLFKIFKYSGTGWTTFEEIFSEGITTYSLSTKVYFTADFTKFVTMKTVDFFTKTLVVKSGSSFGTEQTLTVNGDNILEYSMSADGSKIVSTHLDPLSYGNRFGLRVFSGTSYSTVSDLSLAIDANADMGDQGIRINDNGNIICASTQTSQLGQDSLNYLKLIWDAVEIPYIAQSYTSSGAISYITPDGVGTKTPLINVYSSIEFGRFLALAGNGSMLFVKADYEDFTDEFRDLNFSNNSRENTYIYFGKNFEKLYILPNVRYFNDTSYETGPILTNYTGSYFLKFRRKYPADLSNFTESLDLFKLSYETSDVASSLIIDSQDGTYQQISIELNLNKYDEIFFEVDADSSGSIIEEFELNVYSIGTPESENIP
jgi:hypothetical protein